MERMDKRFRDELGLHHPAHCLKIVIDKVNEIVDWINENELALVIIADWVAGKEKIFDRVVDQVEKEEQARGEHDPK